MNHEHILKKFYSHMVAHIPAYHAFYDADVFMSSFMAHLDEMTVDGIEAVLKIYRTNSQCINRARHTADMDSIRKYLEERKANSDK